MNIELGRWHEAFDLSFQKSSDLEICEPSSRALMAIAIVNDNPDAVWSLSFEDRVLLLPFLFMDRESSPIHDASEILGDYRLMLLTPAEPSSSQSSWWQFVETQLSPAQNQLLAEALNAHEEWDIDDLKYPGWECREEHWGKYLS